MADDPHRESRPPEGASARAAPKEDRGRRWQQENADAIAEYNAFIAARGVPPAMFRTF